MPRASRARSRPTASPERRRFGGLTRFPEALLLVGGQRFEPGLRAAPELRREQPRHFEGERARALAPRRRAVGASRIHSRPTSRS